LHGARSRNALTHVMTLNSKRVKEAKSNAQGVFEIFVWPQKHDVQTPSSIYTSRESTVTFCETLTSPLYRTVFLRCRHSWLNRDSGLD